LAEKQTPITLEFEDGKPSSELEAIRTGDEEVPDLYLEPEFIGALQGGDTPTKQVREWVALSEVPPHIWQSIVAIEDQHFLEHIGLDWRGLARAMWVNLRQLRFAQGGSTLTQQLVKNLMERRDKDVFKKANEVFLSLLLELRFSKQEILERYLNEVYLGQIGPLEIHGVSEGAKYFFGKNLQEVTVAEAALMAALIRGPSLYSPYRYRERAMERQRLVLKKMNETGYIAQEELTEALQVPIRLTPAQAGVSTKAPYFIDYVKAQLHEKLADRYSDEELPNLGLRVYTTLDPAMNSAAQKAVATGVARLEKDLKMAPKNPSQRLEGALAAVDHSTGFIRALIGGRSYADSTFNRILNMRRQVGSTFKPIVFLAAIQNRKDHLGIPLGPGYPVEDAPYTLTYDQGRQTWSPKNYDPEFRGWISMRQAVAHSVNTAAARIKHEIGTQSIVSTAHGLGVSSELPAVPSLALGVAELSPVELLKVYAAIANHGRADELTVIRSVTQDDGTSVARFVSNPKWVADPASIDLLIDLMTSVFSEGTASVSKAWGWTRPSAGKTGTTSLHRDSWFAGFTPQLTSVVWVGWDQVPPETKKLPKLTGATAALPIWTEFMKVAHSGEPVTPFPLSPHLVEVHIDRKTGKRAASGCSTDQILTERYIQGHEPTEESCAAQYPPSIREATEE
ncbi:MAG: PBP1A family penicillin-binding protein, partial [Bdellovibrionales bacterium]|nr:PBP1A family penicillin-binding protein [Bdellovibrionales bacterium]